MKRFELKINDALDNLLNELAEQEGRTRSSIVIRAITLYTIAQEQKAKGNKIFVKDGENLREITGL